MKDFIFCARNIEDYVKPINDVKGKTPLDLTDENILENDEVQELFAVILKSHFDEKIFFDAPISNAVDTGLDGVKLDFNFGLRLEIPEGNFHVQISDADSDLVFFDKDISDVRLTSLEKYFIRWQVEIFREGAKIFSHVFNAEGKQVLIHFPKIGMGDIISMLPYVEEFRRQNKCAVSVKIPEYLREFAAYLYPKLNLVDEINLDGYAAFNLFMPVNVLPVWSVDYRNYPLGKIAGVALGFNEVARKPKFKPTAPPVTSDDYVCIGVQASQVEKCWLYPDGWNIVIDYLKRLGYRVFCIDRDKENSNGKIKIVMPEGAEDFTGDLPIMDRANMLCHAKFFIGLSSGLSWLADAVDCPTILISGFSQDWAEFYTPYRVANRMVCNGCFNDRRVSFVKNTCPYQKNTWRELECQKNISPRQVIDAVENLIIDKKLTPPIMN